MRALVDPNPAEVVKALDQIEAKGGLNNDIQRAMVWARLKLYDRMSSTAEAVAYVRRLAGAGIESWQVEYLYPWVLDRADLGERIELARMVQPAVAEQPEMDRRFRALITQGLLDLGDVKGGYDEARTFAKLYPTSGDAWQLLAQAAEANDQPIEADRAWSVITDKAIPTMPVWWQGMLTRVRLRLASTRPADACKLLVKVVQQREYLPKEHAEAFAAVEKSPQCALGQAEPAMASP